MESVRINKYLAQRGDCSRREADQWIDQGWVFVNGVCLREQGTKIDPDLDQVEIRKPTEALKRYYLLNKPLGYLSTVGEQEGWSLLRLIPHSAGLFPIGRLDKDSEGLIIVTDDRTLQRNIIGESSRVEKEYRVLLRDELTPGAKHTIEEGLSLRGKQLRPCRIYPVSPTQCSIVLTEGKNRQVRRVFERVGNQVLSLTRVRIGDLALGTLNPGEYRVVDRSKILASL